MKRITAIYARQSIDKKDSVSIEPQIEQCRNYIGVNSDTEEIEVYSEM